MMDSHCFSIDRDASPAYQYIIASRTSGDARVKSSNLCSRMRGLVPVVEVSIVIYAARYSFAVTNNFALYGAVSCMAVAYELWPWSWFTIFSSYYSHLPQVLFCKTSCIDLISVAMTTHEPHCVYVSICSTVESAPRLW